MASHPPVIGLAPIEMARLETMPLRARIIVDGALSGLHRARLRGSSVEFEQHKEYTPGDDIRHLDWKAYAKADRYYIKQFEQEAELSCLLVVDGSASMSYRGEGVSKLEYAINLSAALSYLLIRQRDRVGLLAFGSTENETYVPPRARAQHLHDIYRVLKELSGQGGSGSESISRCLQRTLERCGRKRMLVMVVSDFFDAGDFIGRLRQLRVRGHDVVVFHTLDRHELEFPFDGLTLFEDLESESQILTHPTPIRRHYQKHLTQFLTSLEQVCIQSGIERHLVATDTPFDVTVRRFIERRLAGASNL